MELERLPRLLFGFREPVGRRTYALTGFSLMALKYAVDALIVYVVVGRIWTPVDYLNPLLGLRDERLGPLVGAGFHIAMGAWALPFLWIGLSMSLRRSFDAGESPWFGLLFLVPFLNYLVMLVLCAMPGRPDRQRPFGDAADAALVDGSLVSAMAAALIALAFAGIVGLVSIYGASEYGITLFAGAPFLLGLVSSYLYNAAGPRSKAGTFGVASLALFLALLTMLLFAFEGILCLFMAAPLLWIVVLLGAFVGRLLALAGRAPGWSAGAFLLALPGTAALESRWRAAGDFAVTTSIMVDAPPERVWRHVVSFSQLQPPTELLFRTGIAYPVRARIEGRGVGAIRRCEFSTGPFVEPITVWDEPRRLAFDVVAQPPSMHELSPYDDVHPPHLDGFLRSQGGEFRLVPLEGGRTRLEGTTRYDLSFRPTAYWRLWVDFLIHRIHRRVLEHVAREAEAE